MAERPGGLLRDGVPDGLEAAPLTRRVFDYERVIRRLVPEIRDGADWAQLAELVSVNEFERIGTFMEVHDWNGYAEMLTRWASSIDSFETTVRRIREVGNLVYFEIEERHWRGEDIRTVNTMTVFEFDSQEKIRHLAVYSQQPG